MNTPTRRLVALVLPLAAALSGALVVEAAPATAAVAPPIIDGVTNGRIVFSDDRAGNREIYSMAADGSDIVRLTDDPAADTFPRWSPDGLRIIFSRGHEIWTMAADGSDEKKIVSYAWPGEPTYSPDGSRIAFSREDDIVVADADGSNELVVADGVPTYGNGAPDWHPDGDRIAYRSLKGPGNLRLESVRPDGTDVQPLTDGGGFEPRWSTDGDWLAFEELGLSTKDPQGDIERVVFLNGAGEGMLEGLDWAPDQTGFVYAQRRHDGTSWTHPVIKTVASDGTGIVTLTEGWQPDWQAVAPLPPAPDTTAEGPRWNLGTPIDLGSDTDGATFECSLDDGAWAACAAPYRPAVDVGDHTLRVRAVSAGGTDASPATVSWTTPYDDRALRSRGRWTRVKSPAFYRGGILSTTRKGASLTRRNVRATALVLVATTCRSCGKVDVFSGRKRIAQVSLRSTSTRNRVVIPLRSWTRPRKAATIRLVATTSGKPVRIDGLGVSLAPNP